ncbi:uncharacterized protein EI97DRAFT_500213 [Westerdykella ornata]|uniref:Uncharacterized protein n=1 Tax=Westerdykella ornata TaxID=318751 RepID=A0A6A6JNB3_WESOR|nr:uncharacterized protein EI97DRAFT_500213 [Westerdykella ornata]KAF2278002.1 hypothetical protein EI97DRAFT_500213 [Westerdykella ornata]
MTTPSPSSANNGSSRAGRAIQALPLLFLSVLAFYNMDILHLMLAPNPIQDGKITYSPTRSVTLPEKFHLIPGVDPVIRNVVTGFAPSTLEEDKPSAWQMVVFLSDCGLLHLLWCLEGERGASRGGPAGFPTLFQTLAQLVGGGTTLPIVYFLSHVFRSPLPARPTYSIRINTHHAFIYTFLLLPLHSLPVWLMYHASTLQDRHWWTWLWQLYPVRVSLGYYILRTLFETRGRKQASTATASKPNSIHHSNHYHRHLLLALLPLIAISAGLWLHTLLASSYSLYEIFYPSPLPDELLGTFTGQMQVLLKWDYIFVVASSLLWWGYEMWDLKRVGRVTARGIAVLVVMWVGMGMVLGPAVGVAVVWLVREWYLVGGSGPGTEGFEKGKEGR